MARSNKASNKVDSTLVAAIDKLVREVTLDKTDPVLDDEGKPKTGYDKKPLTKPRYTLTDVMKVVDRKLKLEAIRLKADDAGYAVAFGADDTDGA